MYKLVGYGFAAYCAARLLMVGLAATQLTSVSALSLLRTGFRAPSQGKLERRLDILLRCCRAQSLPGHRYQCRIVEPNNLITSYRRAHLVQSGSSSTQCWQDRPSHQ